MNWWNLKKHQKSGPPISSVFHRRMIGKLIKRAYLKQMFEKLGSKKEKNNNSTVKLSCQMYLERHVENLERHQRSLRDR